jgi:hypothetical protein
MGDAAAIPEIPAEPVPAREPVSIYLSGVARGIAAALKEKAVREAPSD